MQSSLSIALYFLCKLGQTAKSSAAVPKLQQLISYEIWKASSHTPLDAIERTHPAYAPTMSTVLAEAMAIPEDTPTMDANDFRVWLIQL